MTTPKYKLQAQVEVTSSMGEYQIDWARIEQQCREAAEAVKKIQQLDKEPDVKKKGRKKKGY